MNYEKLTKAQQRKLLSIENRMVKANKDILAMGFHIYLANDTVNIINGPSHGERERLIHESVMHSFTLSRSSGGDW